MHTPLEVKNNRLFIGGADTVELAQKYGTPLYVFDEIGIRNAMKEYKSSIDEYYEGNGMALYASKAFSCKEMYRIAADQNIGVDVVSGGELYTALSAGFPAENIFFHGNNKTYDELLMAVEKGVGTIVIDSFEEIELLSGIAQKANKSVRAMLRIKPGVDAHTHEFIRTGQIDSKFGFALDGGEALKAVKAAYGATGINLVGFHCHIGSQIFGTEPFKEAAEIMLRFMAELNRSQNLNLNELDLGGGFGIRYVEGDTPIPYGEFMKAVSATVKEVCTRLNMDVPKIYIEPGRSIVGPFGITLYTVGNVKEIKDVRTYVAVDGGMGDNPRYPLYGAEYEVVIANKADGEKDFIATVAGKCCESGDLIGENIKMQAPSVGDIMAVLATGAYNYSMASNYNRLPRPAAVMVKEGKSRVIINRESYEDLVSKDV